MFASSSRLDLIITVWPKKPSHIKTILSSPLPISIEYRFLHGDLICSALWRMRAALRHRDRVREISFSGRGVSFGKFFRATNYHFPALESLTLWFRNGHEPDIPTTFLRGPDQSDLRLRRLELHGPSLPCISGFLLSATALTDLTLDVSSNAAVFDSSQRSVLLAYLLGMQCLRSLNLSTPNDRRNSQSQTPKDIVPLLKLTRFRYDGSTIFLNNLMSGLSAPSLQDARFELQIMSRSPLLYLSRFIDDVNEEFRSICVTFDFDCFRLLSSTHSGKTDYLKSSFRFNVNCYPDSIISINNTPSMKLAKAEELELIFHRWNITEWEHIFSLRKFLRQFRSVRVLRVRVLRVNPFVREVGLYLQQDDGEAILPALEEIELSISHMQTYSEEECQRHAANELAAFEPFVSARKRAGRIVKVYHREQTQSK